jgi:hypothetical protein
MYICTQICTVCMYVTLSPQLSSSYSLSTSLSRFIVSDSCAGVAHSCAFHVTNAPTTASMLCYFVLGIDYKNASTEFYLESCLPLVFMYLCTLHLQVKCAHVHVHAHRSCVHVCKRLNISSNLCKYCIILLQLVTQFNIHFSATHSRRK